MENLNIKPNKVELSEFEEKVRTKIDDNTDLVVYNAYPKQPYDEESLKIILEQSQSHEILLDFSDKGTKIVPVIFGFVAMSDGSKIGVPAKALLDPKEIFGLLHELGHIDTRRKKGDELFKKYLEAKSTSMNPDVDNLIIQITEERDAWASAMWQARKIKKELGVNLFGLFKNSDEFMGWLRVTGLRTYEHELEQLSGEKAYTKDKQVQKYLESINELNNEVEKNYAEAE